MKLREYASRMESADIAIEHEEEHILKKLGKDVEHRDWRAVRRDVSEAEGVEGQAYRLETEELKEYQSGFLHILRIIKQNGPFPEDTSGHIGELANFARNYERIFRHLWRKERTIGRSGN